MGLFSLASDAYGLYNSYRMYNNTQNQLRRNQELIRDRLNLWNSQVGKKQKLSMSPYKRSQLYNQIANIQTNMDNNTLGFRSNQVKGLVRMMG